MKLKRQYEKQDEIPQTLRDFYVEQDGKWVLDADAAESGGDDVEKLKRTLEAEKTQRKQAVANLEKLTAKYKDIDPEKALEAQQKLDQLEEDKLKAEKKYEELADRKFEKAKRALEEQIASLKASFEKETKMRQEVEELYESKVIDTQLKDIGLKKGADPTKINYFVELIRKPWKLTEDKKGIVAMEGDQVRYGKDPSKPLTIEEFFEDLPKSDPILHNTFFLGSSGGGASNGGRLSSGAVTITREEARNIQNYEAAKARAEKAGVPLQVQ